MFTTRILLVLSIVGADLLLMAFPDNTSENRWSTHIYIKYEENS
jgi:hypothetical protein